MASSDGSSSGRDTSSDLDPSSTHDREQRPKRPVNRQSRSCRVCRIRKVKVGTVMMGKIFLKNTRK